MDKKLRQEKLKMWQGKLAQLEKELGEIIQRKSEAAAMGDISENAPYKQAVEDADSWRVRIADVKKIILDLEKN